MHAERNRAASAAADRQRLTDLFLQHGNAIHAYARNKVTAEAANDVVSEVFAVAWRRLDSIRLGEERPWLFGVARRVIATERRQAADWIALHQRLREYPDEHLDDQADGIVERRKVITALGNLSEADREVLWLRYWYDLTGRDAAHAAGCSQAAFAVRLHRAKRRFAEAVQAQVIENGLDARSIADHLQAGVMR
ncbi:sigma-70 family RNA polymerase sigma factor [Micromonospora lupini]|uniref:RNA polymerase sigma factor n=1 Tax=Micromonospora lupini TaxID=285679 RepID=UPI00225A72AE|nr:sigma-70 family RNA polymerase sigma factor [Micromonospora lupini]MCX5066676.1 sigma-70 family RNA polymerase sigma factor [Micromonospora lupini]